MSKFAKRHYEAIAATFQDCFQAARLEPDAEPVIEHVISEFADMFARDNGSFDRARFVYACQPGSNVKARTAHHRVNKHGL